MNTAAKMVSAAMVSNVSPPVGVLDVLPPPAVKGSVFLASVAQCFSGGESKRVGGP